MRLILFSFLWVIFLANTCSAQSEPLMGPRIGGGIRVMNYNGEGEIGFGFRAGIKSRFPFAKKWALLPSVDFTRKGFHKYEFYFWNGFDNLDQRLSYLDIAVPVNYNPVGVVNIYAGLQLGILVKGEIVRTSNLSENNYRYSISDQIRKLDPGIVFGTDVQFKIGLGIGYSFNFGLLKVYNSSSDASLPDLNYHLNGKNFLTTLDFHYLFRLKPASKQN